MVEGDCQHEVLMEAGRITPEELGGCEEGLSAHDGGDRSSIRFRPACQLVQLQEVPGIGIEVSLVPSPPVVMDRRELGGGFPGSRFPGLVAKLCQGGDDGRRPRFYDPPFFALHCHAPSKTSLSPAFVRYRE